MYWNARHQPTRNKYRIFIGKSAQLLFEIAELHEILLNFNFSGEEDESDRGKQFVTDLFYCLNILLNLFFFFQR